MKGKCLKMACLQGGAREEYIYLLRSQKGRGGDGRPKRHSMSIRMLGFSRSPSLIRNREAKQHFTAKQAEVTEE